MVSNRSVLKIGIKISTQNYFALDKKKLECNSLQLAYNDLGDMSSKLGKLRAGKKAIYRDPTLALIDLYQSDHTYYAAVYDDVHKDSFLSCAPIVLLPKVVLK